MSRRRINGTISYIEGKEDPLSSDIGIVKEKDASWLYDVGAGENMIAELDGEYNVVLSHFHRDHIGNIARIRVRELYVSKETSAYIPKETLEACSVHIVTEPIRIGGLLIFPLPSSHAKGSLGMEADGTYAFVGDALYCRTRKNAAIYNAQLLKEEIEVLKNLRASYLLVSHYRGLIREKREALKELEAIYATRTKDSAEIPLG